MSAFDVEILAGKTVVLDLSSPYVCLGVLESSGANYLTLRNADMHDLRDSRSTRELYVLQAKQHGIRINRERVLVRIQEIVSISALDDVVE